MYSTCCCCTVTVVARTRLSVTLHVMHCLSCSQISGLRQSVLTEVFSYLFLRSFKKPLVHHPGAECGRFTDYSDSCSLARHSDHGATSISRHYANFVQNIWFEMLLILKYTISIWLQPSTWSCSTCKSERRGVKGNTTPLHKVDWWHLT